MVASISVPSQTPHRFCVRFLPSSIQFGAQRVFATLSYPLVGAPRVFGAQRVFATLSYPLLAPRASLALSASFATPSYSLLAPRASLALSASFATLSYPLLAPRASLHQYGERKRLVWLPLAEDLLKHLLALTHPTLTASTRPRRYALDSSTTSLPLPRPPPSFFQIRVYLPTLPPLLWARRQRHLHCRHDAWHVETCREALAAALCCEKRQFNLFTFFFTIRAEGLATGVSPIGAQPYFLFPVCSFAADSSTNIS